MTRRSAAAVLAALALGAVAGCGGNGDEDGSDAGAHPGRAIFTSAAEPTCSSCHTLADAGATGTVGPNLDDLQPSLERVERAVKEGPGAMPSFSGELDEQQVQLVAEYVAQAAGP